MKFLCVPCDEAMTLAGTEGPEEGSLTVILACPRCSNKVAMLTNPLETQLVRALDVKVGGPGSHPTPLQFVRSTLATKREGLEGQSGNQASGQSGSPGCPIARSPDCPIAWSPEAERRLERIPSLVRPMVRQGIERFARQHGYWQISEQVMDEARRAMGM